MGKASFLDSLTHQSREEGVKLGVYGGGKYQGKVVGEKQIFSKCIVRKYFEIKTKHPKAVFEKERRGHFHNTNYTD